MSNTFGRPWKIRNIRQCAGPAGVCRFAVTLDRGNDTISDLKIEAAALLDYRAFQARVLETSGRLVRFDAVEAAPDSASAWLDLVEATLSDESARKSPAGFCPSPPPPRYNTHEPVFQEIGGGD
jgi:hypothetical protein